MDPENFKIAINSGRLYQIIEPGHHRSCGGIDLSGAPSVSIVTYGLGGIDLSDTPSVSIVTYGLGGSGGREHVD